MLSPTERFSNRVADYVRARPSYPAEVIDLLVRESALNSGSTIADVGCGTGIFTQQLLTVGCKVIGIEPNELMRDAAVTMLGHNPLFKAIDGTGEATGLDDQSIDLITAAQAFHWFNPIKAREEFKRILNPDGKAALVWNERRSTGSPFSVGYEAILHAFVPEYEKVRHRNTSDKELLDWYRNDDAKLSIFNNDHRIDLETLLARAFSSSYMPAKGSAEHPAVEHELRTLFKQTQEDGFILFEYETKIFLGQLG